MIVSTGTGGTVITFTLQWWYLVVLVWVGVLVCWTTEAKNVFFVDFLLILASATAFTMGIGLGRIM